MRIFCVFSADILHYLVWWCHECATQSTNTNFLYLPLNLFYIMCMPTLWTLDLEPGHYIEVCTSQRAVNTFKIQIRRFLQHQTWRRRDYDNSESVSDVWRRWRRRPAIVTKFRALSDGPFCGGDSNLMLQSDWDSVIILVVLLCAPSHWDWDPKM